MLTYKELIDLAIGSPESGHVNFFALQVLLTCFAQRLQVLDEVVAQDDYLVANLLTLEKDSRLRLEAGEDAEGEAPAEAAKEEPVEETPPPAAVEEGKAEENIPAEVPGETTAPEPGEAQTEPTPDPAPANVEAPAPANVEAEGQKAEPVPDQAPPAPPATEPEHKDDESFALASVASSRLSTRDKGAREGSLVNNLTRLERRLSKVELLKEQVSVEMEQFMRNFTIQMRLTMEQVNNVAHMLIDRHPDPQRTKVIRLFAKQMRAVMGTTDKEVSISWSSGEVEGGVEGVEEGLIEDEFEEESDWTPSEWGDSQLEADKDLDHPRTLERVHADILELKSHFCALTNRVNDLSAALLRQDCQKLLGTMKELQDGIREMHVLTSSNRETISIMMKRLNEATTQIDFLLKSAALLDEVKSDRNEVELLLAEKVNFQQLATKVSLEQLEDYKEAQEKMFCEVRYVVSSNERNVMQIIDNLRMSLGIDAMELGLKDFRELVEKKVQLIADTLQRYMDMTNDDCAAAAGRVKVLQDLACLSCDSTCVMRSVERSKLPSLPKAKSSVGLGPIIAYEVGQIRDSGVMGYYCKDSFPHTPHAWTKGTPGVLKCTGRHAGGMHTIHTAEEHMQKVVLSKKNTGWI